MIDVLYYSIAGKKSNQVIDDIIQTFIESDYISAPEKKILKHTQEVAKQGAYPSPDYYQTFYAPSPVKYSSIAEIVTYSNKTLDFYKAQSLQRNIIKAINESDSTSSLISKIEDITSSVDKTEESDSLDAFKPVLYSSSIDRPESKGIMTGITEIDEKTNGFQPGSIATVAAFTGHGKSTFSDSVAFNNALEGKKVLIVSLEMAPELVWPIFQARYLYQVKGLQVNSQDIMMHKLPTDVANQVTQYDADFTSDICNNLMVLDESVLTKNIVTSYRSLQKLLRNCERRMHGLDLVIFDHVGQFELLFPTMGNQILKTIQSAVKTYQTEQGTRPVSLWAVQTNREGEKRARKRSGVYDLQAISDLNEVERSSAYIIFMYTSDDDKINQETHVTLAKHRYGEVVSEPVTTTFAPNISTVGSSIQEVTVSDDDFASFGSDFSFDADAF